MTVGIAPPTPYDVAPIVILPVPSIPSQVKLLVKVPSTFIERVRFRTEFAFASFTLPVTKVSFTLSVNAADWLLPPIISRPFFIVKVPILESVFICLKKASHAFLLFEASIVSFPSILKELPAPTMPIIFPLLEEI